MNQRNPSTSRRPARVARLRGRQSRITRAVLGGACALLLPQVVKAATLVWTPTAGGTTYAWNTGANWDLGTFPNAIDDVANLNNDIAADQTVSLNQFITVGTLNIGDASGSSAFTLAAGTGGYLSFNSTTGAQINKTTGGADVISTSFQFLAPLAITNNSASTLSFTGANLRGLESNISFDGSGTMSVSGAISTAGGLTKSGTGNLTLTGASIYSGPTTANGGTLTLSNASALPSRSAVTVAAGATLDYANTPTTIGSLAGAGTVTDSTASAARILTIGRDDTSTTFSGKFLAPTTKTFLAITKIGGGTLTLQPTGSNVAGDYTGNTIINGGAINLDFTNSTLNSGLLAATPLQLGGGNFTLTGRSGATVTQGLGAFTLLAGGGSLTVAPNGGTSTTLALTTFTATATGGALLVNAPAGTAVTTTTAVPASGIYGAGRAVFTDGAGNYDWLSGNSLVSPIKFAGLGTGVGGATDNIPSYTGPLSATGGGGTTDNRTLTGGQTQGTAATTIGTLKITSSGAATPTLNLNGFDLTLNASGLLFTGTDAYSINATTAGNLKGASGAGGNLIIHQYGTNSAGLTINAGLADNTTGTASDFVKAGPGLLTIAGANAFTGLVYVDGGTLSFSNAGATGNGTLGLGVAKAVNIRDGATLQYTGGTGVVAASTTANSHTFSLIGGQATMEVTAPTSTLGISGVISGAGGLTKTGPGILQLSGANTYTGPTIISAGTLLGSGAGFLADSSPVTINAGAVLDINGTAANQTEIIGSLSGSGSIQNSNTNTKTLAVGGDNTSTTFSGNFTGTGGNGFTKQGSGTLTLTGTMAWTGTKSINGGVLRLGAANVFPTGGTVTLGNGAGPSMLDLAGFSTTSGGLSFGGSSAAASSQAMLALGGGTFTVGGTSSVTYTSTNNPLGASITATGAGNLNVGVARTFTIQDSTSVLSSEYELSIFAPVTGGVAITKDGAGNLLLAGNNSYSGVSISGIGTVAMTGDNTSVTGATTINSGTLILDYTSANKTKLNATGSLSLLGGTTVLLGNSGADSVQVVASTTLVNAAGNGNSIVTLSPGAGRGLALDFGALTRTAGTGTVRLNLGSGTQSATNGFLTSTGNDAVTGLVGTGGGWLTVTSGGETNFGTVAAGNIVPILPVVRDSVATWVPGLNITDSTGFSGTLDTETTVNSIRFNSSSASAISIAAGGVLRVDSGGILQTTAATGTTSISGGRIAGNVGSEVIFTTDSATQSLDVSSGFSGATLITKSGAGTLRLSGLNYSTGAMSIQGGIVDISGGFAIGDTQTVSFAPGRTATLSLSSGTETIGNLSGGTTSNGSSVVSLGSGVVLTINQTSATTYSGLFTGAGSTIVKAGASTLTYAANSTYSGALVINAGQITANGNFNQFPSVASITLNGPTSVLSLPNDQTNSVTSRIGDTVPIFLNNTTGALGFFYSRTGGTTSGTETVGQLTLGGGQNTIAADGNGTSRIGVIKFSNATPLVRNNFSTALLVARSFDGVAAQRGGIAFSADPGGSVGGGAAGTGTGGTSYSIYPFFVGENVAGTPAATNVGNSFVTFIDTTAGVRPLNLSSEYTLEAAGFNGLPAGPATNNVRFTTGATLTGPATAINSLVLDSATGVALVGPASALEVTSGALLAAGAGASSISGFTGLTTASRPYYVYVTSSAGSLTLTSPLTTAQPLVKSGAGTLVLSSASNNFTDLYLNLGSVSADSITKLGSGALNFFGGGLVLTGNYDPSQKTMTFGSGGGTLDTAGNNITLANPIGNGGTGGLTKAGTGTLTLAATPTYTGATAVTGGRLVVAGGADNRLPTTVGVSLTGTGVLQLGDTLAASNQTVTELSGAATASIVGGSATVSTLTVNQNTTTSYLGFIGGAGANENNITLIKTGNGTLNLGAVASTFTGGIFVKAGTLTGGNNANVFGASANVITLGDVSGSADVTLNPVNTNTYANPINVIAGSTGAVTIAGSANGGGNPTLSGPITIARDLIISKIGTTGTLTLSGGITGTGNLIIDNFGTTGVITLSTNAINPVGSIKNAGIGSTATTTISASIGSNVTNIIQDSSTSALTLSGATIAYTGATIVNAGTLTISGSAAAPITTSAITVAGGATFSTINTAGQTINLGSGALSLGLGSGVSTLGMDVGASSDAITTTATATTGNSVKFNLNGLSGFGAGTYTLLSAAGGLNGATYSLGSATGALAGLALNITSSATAVQLNATPATGDFYWKGAVNNSWTGLNGLNTNFTTDPAGTSTSTIDVNGTPGLNSSVFFSAAGQTGSTLSTTLDGAFTIKDLTFNSSVGTGPLTAITVATGTGGSNLALVPTDAAKGINLQTGAPAAINISAPVILGANQSWTVADAATVLTVSGGVTGNGFSLSKEGAGTLVLTTANASTYTGITNVNNGVLRAGSATAFSANSTHNIASGAILRLNAFNETIGALAGAAGSIVENGGATNITLTAGANNSSTTFAGTLQNGGANTLGLTKSGTGTLTLTGAMNQTGSLIVSNGTLVAAGTSTATGNVTVGNSTTNAVLNVPSGGAVTGGTITVGTSTGPGAVNITGGSISMATPENTDTISFGASAGGYGAFTMSSGSFTQQRFMFGGTSTTTTTGGMGIGLVTGGTVNSTGFIILARAGTSTGVLTMTGGLIDHSGASQNVNVGYAGSGRAELNIAGGLLDTTGRIVTFGGGTWTGTGIANLNAGTLLTNSVSDTSGTSIFNFNGGTLKASATSSIFLSNTIDNVYSNGAFGSFAGGAVVDSNNFAITFGKPIQAPTGNGVSTIALSTSGSGYIGAPYVQITGDGTGATGYAVVDTDANSATFGQVTSVVITNPGVNYTTASVTLVGGGGTGATANVGLAANTSGGLTKNGAGTLTLGAVNTYTGTTTVNAGSVTVGIANAIPAASSVVITGGSLDLGAFSNSVAAVTLQSGSITGSTGVLTSAGGYDFRAGTVSAILAGSGGITKTTNGTLTLSGTSTFSGPVNANGGILSFATSAHLGNASSTNALGLSGGTLRYTGAGALDLTANRTATLGASGGTFEVSASTGILTLSGGIVSTSTGNLTKSGPGTLIIPGTTSWNSGVNSVTVSDGTLQAGFGTNGIGSLVVSATGVMDFRNTFTEMLTLTGSAGALTLSSGARLGFELGVTNDGVVVGTGGTAVVTGNVTLDFYNLGGLTAGTYNVLTAPSGLSSATYTLGNAPAGFNYTINVSDSLVSLGVVAFVPRYWTNSQATGSWATLSGGTLSNWSTDAAGATNYGALPTAADTVVFSASSVTGTSVTTTLDGDYSVDGLQFIPGSGTVTSTTINRGTTGTLTLAPSSTSGGILVAANAGTATINAPVVVSTSQTWNIDGSGANGSALVIPGSVSFNAPVNKTGAGAVTLSGANTGTGAITLSAGTLNINSATAIGTGALSIAPGTTINNTSGAAVVLSTNNTLNWNGSFTFTGSNALTFGSGQVNLGQNVTTTVSASTLTVGGAITDGGGNRTLTKAGNGTLAVSGNVTLGGGLSVTAGTVSLTGSTNSIGGPVSVSAGALTTTGANTFGSGLAVSGGSATLSGASNITGGVVLSGGTLNLAAANTIVGGVNVTSGTLNLAHGDAVGAALSLAGGTIDNTSGAALTLTSNPTQTWAGNFSFTGTNNLNLGTGAVTLTAAPTITVAANTLTVGGVIGSGSNILGITKSGAGTLRLAAGATYTGATTIGQGTLAFDVTQALTDTTNTVFLGSSAGSTTVVNLDLNNASATFGGGFTVQTASASANTIAIGSGQTLRLNGAMTVGYNSASNSTTKLTVSGAGTLSIGAAGQPVNTNFQLGAGQTAAISNAGTLDLSGLATFYANLGSGTFRVGSATNSTGTAAAGSTLILSPNTTIIATSITSDSPDTGVTQAIKLSSGTNVFNATTIELGGSTSGRTAATLDFSSVSGTFTLRGLAGGATRATTFNVQNGATATGSSPSATANFNGHSVDIMVTNLNVAGRSAATTGSGTGVFSFDTGTLDATTVSVANRSGTTFTTGNVTGTVNLMALGGTGTATIGTFNIGTNSASTATTSGQAKAIVNIGGGTVNVTTATLATNSIGGGATAQTNAPVDAALNITGGTANITTLNMNVNSSANTGTGNASVATLNVAGGTLNVGTGGINMVNASNAAATGTSIISISNTGVVNMGGNLVYTAGAGTENTTLLLNGGTLNMGGFSIGASGALVGSGTGSVQFNSGTLRNVAQFNNGAALVKTSGGTLTLDGTNAYTGDTTFAVGGGTLRLGASNAIPDGTGKGNLVTTNGTVDLNGFSDTVNGLSGTGVVDNLAPATASTLTIGGANTVATFSGTLQNTGAGSTLALVKTGTGVNTLNTANTYSGGTTISGGSLQIDHPNALGSGALVINGGVRVVVGTGIDLSTPITLGPNTAAASRGMVEPAAAAGSATVSGPITITAAPNAGGHFAAPTAGSVLNVNGPITSSVQVVSRLGNVAFSGGGTGYTAMAISQDTVSIGANDGLATTAVLSVATSGAGFFDLAGFNQSLAGIVKGANTATIGNSSTTADSTLTISGTSIWAGVIQNALGAGTRKVNLTVSGGGALTLSAANTYTGTTTINAGTLALTGSGAISASSDVSLSNPAAIFDLTTSTLATPSFSSLAGVAGSALNLGSRSIVVGAGNTSTTFAGAMNGTGSLTKQGTGTMILSGANTYSGATTVSAGTLQIGDGSTGTIASISSAAVGASGTLQFNQANGTNFTNSIANSGLVEVTGANSTVLSGAISGTGSFRKSGTGTVELRGNNTTFTGGIEVAGGTLAVSAGNQLGNTSAVTFNGTGVKLAVLDNISTNRGLVFSTAGGVEVSGTKVLTYTGSFSGPGNVTKFGAGTLEIDGLNSGYNGQLNIAEGTVGGSGAIPGAISVAQGGNFAPGNGIGTFSAGTLSLDPLSSGSPATFSIEIDLGAPNVIGGSDLLSLTSSGPGVKLTIGEGAILNVTAFGSAGGFTAGTDHWVFAVYDAAGSVSGNFHVPGFPNDALVDYTGDINTTASFLLSDGTRVAIDYDYNVDTNIKGVALVVVPEPGALASLAGASGLLLGLRRNRRRIA